MEDKYYSELVLIRMERAAELLKDAEELLINGSYKSANNRAYYAIEKAINALFPGRTEDVSRLAAHC